MQENRYLVNQLKKHTKLNLMLQKMEGGAKVNAVANRGYTALISAAFSVSVC